MSTENVLLKVEGVGKEYDGNRVLKDISFTLEKGKILGLVGENGAGKSTLMNILFGMKVISETGGYEGSVYLNGEKIKFKSPVDALKAGIGMVHQEFSLIPGFTVGENVLLNMEKTKKSLISKVLGKRMETIDLPEIRKSAQKAIDTLGVRLDTETLVSEMPVGHKQFIEIAREINRSGVKLIVLDEPTAVLTESEAEVLLKSMRLLADIGISIVFISHRLHEITAICDTIVVLRDGLVVVETPAENVDVRQIAEWMVGRDVDAEAKYIRPVVKIDEKDIIFETRNLWVDMPGETIKNVSLKVRRGEILGIGGLAGQGKLGIPNGIMGLFMSGGEIFFEDKPLRLNNTLNALQSGIAFVSEDRRGVGLLLDEPIDWNIAFNAMQVQNKFLKSYLGGAIKWRDEKAMKACALEYIKSLEIRCTSQRQPVRNLSGGNQQKVCLAKAFAMKPKLLFVSEPTRGIDVGAKKLVLDALRKYNEENNTTIVIISSELEELKSISDRIAIVCEGKIFGILPPDAPVVDFGLLMAGEFKINEEGEKTWLR
ncbi:sugar ABC transporter ATP-binding protein [Clostridium sp. CM028]|uniref:sugar ABC transporter ATP-binding protein n=1 Tax=unclassified Clostridium TaxID=2614128 RepID=UPI001C6E58A5|nr:MULTISPECIES: sugar ABC transporter ATP-binding protein [unclassified Clostridium]MBW9145877.1 sugar ABC transporter ATP-binding protein [Clostridium sp. CM027]MBW9149566.1 sugar ABC transporter ATP-binding protein [Clostridium sp. CM028]UVE42784.1 sugar ABC transporter ATP-binding protein [Clostridium sp. CM027]WLC61525.1 sugar ABC transporter ATP-binding protein [Clostridium sp. CM028]